ncbi:MAG: hypothetical protein PHT71_04585 [Victivallaceae bacterium]|nr:hypothetical protein [Victivallaceae bacterium]
MEDADVSKRFNKINSEGRYYTTVPLHAPGETKNGPTGMMWKGMLPPAGRHWRSAPEELDRLDAEGLIEWSKTGNPRRIIFADEKRSKGKKCRMSGPLRITNILNIQPRKILICWNLL